MIDKVGTRMRAATIGSLDFVRRFNSILVGLKRGVSAVAGGYTDCWSIMLQERANLLFFEIGRGYADKTHLQMKAVLNELRSRFANTVYIVPVIASAEKLFFAGDLLFNNEIDFAGSGLIDSFVVIPPDGFPETADLQEQLTSVITFLDLELERRTRSRAAVPTLNSENWVQSLADPISRELWMRWLPRYASYVNESPIITGPTGSGKTKLANALHFLSERSGPFIGITPRDFSSSELVQAELFGAVAGAYTGAVDKWGLVKSAEKGTLFIDELQSIDKDLQGKLITFVENKSYRRVGSTEVTKADVRFVFATNKPIPEMVETNILRDDFAYRLERVELNLLPLVKRRLDIAAGLSYALAKVRRERPTARNVFGFTREAFGLLFGYSWPGNLRQLENVVAQLCELADVKEQDLIDESMVSRVLHTRLGDQVSSMSLEAGYKLGKPLDGKANLDFTRPDLDTALQAPSQGDRDAFSDPVLIERVARVIGEELSLLIEAAINSKD